MKKNLLSSILIVALSVVVLITAVTVFSFAADGDATVSAEIVSNNVFYGDTLNLAYAVYCEGVQDTDEVTVEIRDANGLLIDTVASDSTDTIGGKECRIFTSEKGVPYHKIGTRTYARAIVKRADVKIYESEATEYSVLEYYMERLSKNVIEGKTDDGQIELYSALLNYASLAEIALTNVAEGNRITDMVYVAVIGGSIDSADYGKVCKKGDTLNSLFADKTDYITLTWKATVFDGRGAVIRTEYLSQDKLAQGYTVNNVTVFEPVYDTLTEDLYRSSNVRGVNAAASFNSGDGNNRIRVEIPYLLDKDTVVTFNGNFATHCFAIAVFDENGTKVADIGWYKTEADRKVKLSDKIGSLVEGKGYYVYPYLANAGGSGDVVGYGSGAGEAPYTEVRDNLFTVEAKIIAVPVP